MSVTYTQGECHSKSLRTHHQQPAIHDLSCPVCNSFTPSLPILFWGKPQTPYHIMPSSTLTVNVCKLFSIWVGFHIFSNLLLLDIELFLFLFNIMSRIPIYINVFISLLTFSKFTFLEILNPSIKWKFLELLDHMVFWSFISLQTHTHNHMAAFLIRNIPHVHYRTFWKYRKTQRKKLKSPLILPLRENCC